MAKLKSRPINVGVGCPLTTEASGKVDGSVSEETGNKMVNSCCIFSLSGSKSPGIWGDFGLLRPLGPMRLLMALGPLGPMGQLMLLSPIALLLEPSMFSRLQLTPGFGSSFLDPSSWDACDAMSWQDLTITGSRTKILVSSWTSGIRALSSIGVDGVVRGTEMVLGICMNYDWYLDRLGEWVIIDPKNGKIWPTKRLWFD